MARSSSMTRIRRPLPSIFPTGIVLSTLRRTYRPQACCPTLCSHYEFLVWHAMPELVRTYPFRPWVRRAGLSIVLVAAGATAAIGWIGERAMWAYIALLWIGGLKVWLGTFRPIAEAGERVLVLRPLHNVRQRAIEWTRLRGTEQMTGGDRLIV